MGIDHLYLLLFSPFQSRREKNNASRVTSAIGHLIVKESEKALHIVSDSVRFNSPYL